MSRLLISTECNKRTCGKCKYREPYSNYEKFPTITSCRCKIFNKPLQIRNDRWKTRQSFCRLKECLQAEKDYLEILLEGWYIIRRMVNDCINVGELGK